MRCPTIAELPPPPPGKTGWPWTQGSPDLSEHMPGGHPWPRISVITPAYNQGQYIEETIRSILLQGYPCLEYMIIDGGSTDGSIDIIRKYASWLAYWVSKPDRGQTSAINKGWRRATGDILSYINSDDSYLPGVLGTVARVFGTKSTVGMVYGAAEIINPSGRKLRTWKAKPFELKTMLAVDNIVPQPTVFFSRKALETVNYLDEKWHMIMDYDLSIRVGMQFTAVCVPQILARFRDHTNSKTRTQYERTTAEILHFGTTFFAQHASCHDVQAAKRATLARYYYLLAWTYALRGGNQSAKARRALFRSLFLSPKFALSHPLQTGYIARSVMLNYFANVQKQVQKAYLTINLSPKDAQRPQAPGTSKVTKT
jgi:glycosyltransferase involved in cell wall biosynthesis